MSKKKEKWIGYVGAFLLPVILIYLVFALVGIYPFGAKSFFSGDLQCQYVYYFSYLHEMLHRNADWVYTFSKTLGGNMTDMISYYLASPFNIIFFFFDATSMPLAILILLSLKMGAMGLSMYWFLRKHWEGYSLWMFSTMYAMSGYVVCYVFEFMWMDGVILFPLILYMLEGFDKSRVKRIHYALFLALAIITNYYIGYMICAACGIFFIVYRLFLQEKLKCFAVEFKCWILFGVYSMLGVMLSGFILVPTVFALRGAKMGNMTLKQLLDFRLLFSPITAFVQMLPFKYEAGQLDRYIPTLYCGTITLLCCVLFFFGKESIRRKIGYLIILSVLFCSTFFAGINSVWHGFAAPTGYPCRFSFINMFFVLYIGAEFWKNTKWLENNKLLKRVLAFFVLTEAILNARFIYNTMDFQTLENYYANVNQNNEIKNEVNTRENDGVFFRIVDGGLNTSWMMNLPSVNSYTSCEQVEARNFLNSLGLGSNNCWNSYYKGNTPELLLPLFSVKYEADGSLLNQKEAVLTIGFFVDKSIKEIELEDTNSVEILKGIWNAVDGDYNKEIVEELTVPENFFEECKNGVVLNFPNEKNLIAYLDVEEEYRIYSDNKLIAEFNQLNKTVNIEDGNREYFISGMSIENVPNVRLYKYNPEEMVNRVNSNQTREDLKADIEVICGNKIIIDVENQTGESQNLLFSLPKERRSWKVYIDGNLLSIEELREGFGQLLMYEVPDGQHTITMRYVARGTNEGITISVVAFLCMVGIIVFEIEERRNAKKG